MPAPGRLHGRHHPARVPGTAHRLRAADARHRAGLRGATSPTSANSSRARSPSAGIRTYISAQGLDEAIFVDALVAKSQGNFMYLRYVLPEIESGVYRGSQTSTLCRSGSRIITKTTGGACGRATRRIGSTHQLPVLVALTVVKEPISIDLIQKFSEFDDRRTDPDGPRTNGSRCSIPREPRTKTGRSRKRYRLYHASFHDFIAAKDEVAEERVSLKGANARIACPPFGEKDMAEPVLTLPIRRDHARNEGRLSVPADHLTPSAPQPTGPVALRAPREMPFLADQVEFLGGFEFTGRDLERHALPATLKAVRLGPFPPLRLPRLESPRPGGIAGGA